MKTQRGFTIYGEFKDTKGQSIRVQKSSAACVDAVWVCASTPEGSDGSPHLNRTQAKRLIKALTKFVEEV
jgi:hypothetical protein